MYYCNTIISDGWPKPTGSHCNAKGPILLFFSVQGLFDKVLQEFFGVCDRCCETTGKTAML